MSKIIKFIKRLLTDNSYIDNDSFWEWMDKTDVERALDELDL